MKHQLQIIMPAWEAVSRVPALKENRTLTLAFCYLGVTQSKAGFHLFGEYKIE